MKRTPTKLIVEKGNILVTDKPMPKASFYKQRQAALESWKQEAYKVAGVDESEKCFDWYAEFSRSNKEGIFDAPAGLVFEVTCKGMDKENCHNDEDCWDKNNCLSKQRVAILSFEEPGKEKPIEKLAEDIEKAGLKVRFGLQPDHIKVIEDELSRYGGGDKAEGKFSKYIWEKLGHELSWEPFTLALYYHRYLSKQPTKEPSSERPDFEKMAEEVLPYRWSGEDDPHGIKGRWFVEDYSEGAERIWNDHVIPLQQEIRQLKNNESIQCPYCSGSGCDEFENEMTACGYCYGDGLVTTKLMKEHIAQSKTELTDDERKELPF